MPTARARVLSAVDAKGLRRVHGYGKKHSALGESETDSDGEGEVRQDPVASRGQVQGVTPLLPHGDAKKYQCAAPATGAELVGWVIMAYFTTDNVWYPGVVVQHFGDSSYSVYYAEDHAHEDWTLPDDELVFRCVSAGSYTVKVSRDMLPSLS